MSISTPSTDTNALLFPAFLYGQPAVCRRQMKAESKKWVKWYMEKGIFSEPKMIPVPPGSVIWTHDGAAEMLMLQDDERRKEPHWHFYLLELVPFGTHPGNLAERIAYHEAYDVFACRYPWGALSLINPRASYHSIKNVVRRIEAVLSFWEKLDTCRYVDLHLEEFSLSTLMLYYTEGTIRMWVDVLRGSAKDLLRAAMEQMRNASEDEIRARVFRRLHQVADTDPELKHREWLKSPGVMEPEFERSSAEFPDWNENMTTGMLGSYLGFLRGLDKKYPNG